MTFPVLLANGPSGYKLTRSLRFRSSASAYLNRTPASATNQKTWTWSGWVKRGVLSGNQVLLSADSTTGGGGIPRCELLFTSDSLDFSNNATGSAWVDLISTAVYRDPSAWYHIVCAVDTTQATAANRVKLYVNGVQITSFSSSGYPAQNDNTPVNSTGPHSIARYQNANSQFLDGYLAEVNFIDGQALTPSSFGSTNAVTGVWQPAAYTGTYGTNGFYLPFTNTTSTTTLGYDSSGNGNNWTPNNISLTAGSTYDSMTDVPTLTSATAANFAVLNPIGGSSSSNITVTNGNLTATTPIVASNFFKIPSSISVSSGKWYFEDTVTALDTNNWAISISGTAPLNDSSNQNGLSSGEVSYFAKGSSFETIYVNGSATYTGSVAASAGDVIGVAFDATSLTVQFYRNNTAVSTAQSITSATFFYISAIVRNNGTASIHNINFGQRPFSYTPPSGFVALNTYNLPASTVITSGTFTGNVSADGPFVYLNGVPTAMTINGNSVTFGTNADKLSNGFKVRSASASYNASGSNTYSISTTGAVFKNANAQGNP